MQIIPSFIHRCNQIEIVFLIFELEHLNDIGIIERKLCFT